MDESRDSVPLAYSNPCEAVFHGQFYDLMRLSRCTCDVGSKALAMLARCGFFYFLRVCGVSVAAGYFHWFAVLSAQGLQFLHEIGLHEIQASVLAVEFLLGEIGVFIPIQAHFVTLESLADTAFQSKIRMPSISENPTSPMIEPDISR